jgi:hypothetical protein
MNILFNWDASVNSPPSGYDITDFKAAIMAAGAQIDHLFSNINVTLSVDVGLGEVGGPALSSGAAAEGRPVAGAWLPYDKAVAELKAHTTNQANLAQLAKLPSTAPTGLSNIYASAGELKAWGLLDPNSVEADGIVGFSAVLPYATTSDRAVAGKYDLQGMAVHEITHALFGRIGGSALQLADYTSPGVFAPSGAAGYFSLDGGVTNLGSFSTQDTADWAKGGDGDPLDLYAYPGIAETNITPQDLALLSWLGFDNTLKTPPPPPVAYNFQVFDQTTGQTTVKTGTPYPGPVAGITNQFIDITPHNLNIAALTPNVFIHTGDGNDGINVSQAGGNNVLDGEGGSNFLVGGIGNDTFLVNDLYAKVPSWTTMEGFHTGDAATIWGLTPNDFQLTWLDGGGAVGHQGLTMYATSAGKPEIAVTLAGASSADLSSGRLDVQFGKVNGMSYMDINRLG